LQDYEKIVRIVRIVRIVKIVNELKIDQRRSWVTQFFDSQNFIFFHIFSLLACKKILKNALVWYKKKKEKHQTQ